MARSSYFVASNLQIHRAGQLRVACLPAKRRDLVPVAARRGAAPLAAMVLGRVIKIERARSRVGATAQIGEIGIGQEKRDLPRENSEREFFPGQVRCGTVKMKAILSLTVKRFGKRVPGQMAVDPLHEIVVNPAALHQPCQNRFPCLAQLGHGPGRVRSVAGRASIPHRRPDRLVPSTRQDRSTNGTSPPRSRGAKRACWQNRWRVFADENKVRAVGGFYFRGERHGTNLTDKIEFDKLQHMDDE